MTGEELRAARLRLGLTLARLGELIEPPIARHDMSKAETGKRPIGKVLEVRLRRALAAAAAAAK